MRHKQTIKSTTTPPPGTDISPVNHHIRQASLSQNSRYYRDILIKFTPQDYEEESKHSSEQIMHQNRAAYQFEVEDIADDSDEERSNKHMNMFQIKSLDTGAVSKTVFAKNFSEHDFLVKDQFRKNSNFMISATGTNKIQLIVRIRPFLIQEQIKECLHVVNDNSIRLFKDFHQIHFKFDNILLPKDPQDAVFSRLHSKTYDYQDQLGIVQQFLMGLNGTIFAYGQTGAGKTYSIMGGEERGFELMSSQKRGILPRTLDQVFSKRSQDSRISVSFYEIYNDKIFDLLSANSSNQQQSSSSQKTRSVSRGASQKPKQSLEIREEKDGQFSIPDLKRYEVKTLEEAYQFLDKGLLKRQTSSTSSNNKSSRSHSVFQIYMERDTESGVTIRSKIRIVDLAGSEKYTIKKDLPQAEKNQKVQELTSINSSLSALGQCISALSDPTRKHIPYRNSKLTKILKDSLDESSNVALIICISPSIDSYKETLSTLQFADRAKKAILDGRNFSDSKLLPQNSDSMNNIMRAYREEQAIRRGLEQYMKQNSQFEVFEELERLKRQNRELQDKVKLLELNSAVGNVETHNLGKQIKSCLKKSSNSTVSAMQDDLINIKIIHSQNSESSLPNIGEYPPEDGKKRVRFALKLENDKSLDSDMRERIEHNLKYNDDTIFDNISIFRDVNNSGVFKHKINDKEKHPLKMKDQYPIEDDEDDVPESKEVEEEKQVPGEMKVPILIQQLKDESLKEFWAIPPSSQKQDNGGTMSPIMKEKPNTSNMSQDLSKDLIELNNDQVLMRKFQDDSGNMSDIRIGDKTMGANKKKQKGNKRQFLQDNNIFKAQPQLEQFQPYEQNMEELEEEVEESESEGETAKDYHVCDTSEQFFEGDFGDNQIIQQAPDFGNDQILTDSIMVIDVPHEEILGEHNGSQENQNTLILDSQSIIIEGDQNINRDNNLSQHMHSLEASSILMQKDVQSNQMPQHYLLPHQPQQNQFFFSLGGVQSQSNANSSNINTDILTYSLTNTFSTIESLHDELAAIRNGLELSHKRGSNILKTIHRYAREIEDPYIPHQLQEEVKEEESNENIDDHDGSSIMDKDISQQFEEENLNFIKDIKGFYSKIHNEIAQLKSILMDSAKNNTSGSPLSSRKHIISEKVPQKNVQISRVSSAVQPSEDKLITPRDKSAISLDHIDKSQEIIFELRKEMENQKSQPQKSLRVLDLLEVLQQSLAHAVTPVKSSGTKISEYQGSSNKKRHPDQQINNFMIQAQKSQFSQQESASKINPKNIIQYEEIQSIQQSPIKAAEESKGTNTSAKQRTPEIFKSLAKLDESELNNNSIPFCSDSRDLIFSQSQQTNYQHINPNIYFSQQSQNQQDFQITLRSYNNVHNQSNSQHNVNLTQTEKKRASAVDNTLTLIFDSDDERGEVKEASLEEDESSPIFNDVEDSQIEKANSFVNGSRTNNNLQTSNSFQADSSLLFFANNIMTGGGDSQDNNLTGNKAVKQRNQSFNSISESAELKGITPDRGEFSKHKPADKSNKKYLLPKGTSKESPDQMIPTFFKPKSAKELGSEEPQQQFMIEENSINQSTSKTSVQKYWNQFFNQNSKSMLKQQQPTGDNNQMFPQQQNQNSRNQHHQASRSAYQSNSFKEEI